MRRTQSNGGTARDLLVTFTMIFGVTTTAIVIMGMVANGVLQTPLLPALLAILAAAVAGRAAWSRLRPVPQRAQRTNPDQLSGEWRHLLAAAWAAREQYVRAAGDTDDGPLADRVTGHLDLIDDTLARCGLLARQGDDAARALRMMGEQRLQRDLHRARRRDPHGVQVRTLHARLEDGRVLRDQIGRTQMRLEGLVRDLRTAAWRATELAIGADTQRDDDLHELLVDLEHLRQALDEVDVTAPRVPRTHPTAGAVHTDGSRAPHAWSRTTAVAGRS